MKQEKFDVAIIYEHSEWHLPLFEALDEIGARYIKIDLKEGAFDIDSLPNANVYYNLVSPSAYLRGNQRAIPYAKALCSSLEYHGHKVLNGTASMSLEFSKSAQIALLSSLKIDHPKTITFNSVDSLSAQIHLLKFPLVLKPEQGGSGARMYLIYSMDELKQLLSDKPELWVPDNLLLLQEKLNYDEEFGIVRLEYINGELLYAMRVLTHGVFNLCPSVVCNPEGDEAGSCEIIIPEKKPEFYPLTDVPLDAIIMGKRIMKAAGHSIGSVEYLETKNGRKVFYDINSNSNLRTSIANAFGKNPFVEVAKFLMSLSMKIKRK